MAAKIQLDLGQFYFALFLKGGAGVINLFPVSASTATPPARIVLHFPLAFNAGGAIGQCIQPSDWDLSLTVFANPIDALLDPCEGAFNLRQFASFQLG